MKSFVKNMLLNVSIIVFGVLYSSASSAVTCQLPSDAKVTNVFQWDDGHIFIYFDRSTNCNCSIANRVAFHKDDDEKMFMAIALTAVTSGKPVWLRAEDNGCPIHGNTAKLKTLGVKP